MAKKKIEETPVSTLELAKKAIIKKYGEDVISYLGDHKDLKIDSISTGCLSLDVATGVGGFARGRIYEIFGPNSSGKSTLALSVVMQGLLRNMTVVYVDAEHALDPRLVRNMGSIVGVNVDKVHMVQAYTGDDDLQIAEDLMKSGEVDILVVDSVSSLLPKAVSEGEIGDNYIGQLSRLMSKACNKLTPLVNRTNTLLIFINQVRHDVGRYGDSRVPTGGLSLPFYATGRIKVEGGESKASRIINDEGIVIGHESTFLVIKNKLAAPWREAKIDLLYGLGYDFVAEVVDLSVDLGITDQTGAWLEYKSNRIQGRRNFIDVIKGDNELYVEMRDKVRQQLGLNDVSRICL